MALLFGRKRSEETEVFDPNPETMDRMPSRPYRVLQSDLALFSDPECEKRIEDARMVILRSEDPGQNHQVQECMPTRKRYKVGQLVDWNLNNKRIWQHSWYINPETGQKELAWTQAVEFLGKVITAK